MAYSEIGYVTAVIKVAPVTRLKISEIGYVTAVIEATSPPRVKMGGQAVTPKWFALIGGQLVPVASWHTLAGGVLVSLSEPPLATLAFAGKTGVPAVMDTGQPVATFNDPGVVVDGRFDSASNSASYFEADLGRNVTRLGARWRFDSLGGTVGGGGSGTMTLVSWADGGIVASGFGRRTSCHVTITAGNVQWWVRDTVDGGSVTGLNGYSIPGGLAPDTDHVVDVAVGDGVGTVTIDGATRTWTDPRIVKYPGERWACWEPYYGGTNKTRVRIAEVWAGGALS